MEAEYHTERAIAEIIAAEGAAHSAAIRAHRRLARLHLQIVAEERPADARELASWVGSDMGPQGVLRNGQFISTF